MQCWLNPLNKVLALPLNAAIYIGSLRMFISLLILLTFLSFSSLSTAPSGAWFNFLDKLRYVLHLSLVLNIRQKHVVDYQDF